MEVYKIELAYPIIKGKKPKEICIKSKDLYYTELFNLDGLQCRKDGKSGDYNKIKAKCREVVKLIREIEELNNGVLPF